MAYEMEVNDAKIHLFKELTTLVTLLCALVKRADTMLIREDEAQQRRGK